MLDLSHPALIIQENVYENRWNELVFHQETCLQASIDSLTKHFLQNLFFI